MSDRPLLTAHIADRPDAATQRLQTLVRALARQAARELWVARSAAAAHPSREDGADAS